MGQRREYGIGPDARPWLVYRNGVRFNMNKHEADVADKDNHETRNWHSGNAGFKNDRESATWAAEQLERNFCFFDEKLDCEYDELFIDLWNENSVIIADGFEFRPNKQLFKMVKKFGLILEKSDEPYDIKYKRNMVYFKVNGKIKGSDEYVTEFTIFFYEDGTIDQMIINTNNGDINNIFSKLFKYSQGAINSAFSVTLAIGDIAESVGIKQEVYMKYIVYIFLTVLIGCSLIVMLLTFICANIICFGGNEKGKYTKVTTITDSEL